jgi:pimeloyl-ACP methyl ester carboxylesterase
MYKLIKFFLVLVFGPLAQGLVSANSGAENAKWYKQNDSDTVVVFVHGIFSNSLECWTAENRTYWPHLLSSDGRFENASIFLGGYYTSATAGIYGVDNAATELHAALREQSASGLPAPISKKGIIFVAHSTGGLVVRYMLDRFRDSYKDKTVGLVLLASPSRGSVWSNRLSWLRESFGSRMAGQLARDNDFVMDLDSRFADLVSNNTLPHLTGIDAFENKFILKGLFFNTERIVDANNNASYFGAFRVLPDTDHFSIAKPTALTHPSHRLLVEFFNDRYKPKLRAASASAAVKPLQPVVHAPTPPLMLSSRSTSETFIDLPAENFRRQVRSSVAAVASTSNDGGCMRIEISGVGESCVGSNVYRNPGADKELRALHECVRTLERATTARIRAVAPNGRSLNCPGTDGVSIDLTVTATKVE